MAPGERQQRRLLRELRRHIEDERVLAAMAAVPRPLFVAEGERRRAWHNRPLAIGEQQTISQPLVVARMCELLGLKGGERVLDVGTGSGYHAAVLARLAAEVVSVERHAELSESAAGALRAAGVEGVRLVVGDGALGFPPAAPFDAINVAAACPGRVPPALEAQLADGGRLVAPVADGDQHLVLVTRRGDTLTRRRVGAVRFVPLVSDTVAGDEP
jgi:protein-L-isoaspartate(D-aspartate) O-methyltransferase